MTTCLWFKHDLRVEDHAPLLEAAARGPVLCLYIYEPEVLQAHYTEASHLGFLNESLRELDASLRQRGNRLITRHGEAVEVFRALHRDVRFNRIYAHQETGPWHTFERDKRVATWARESGVEFREFQCNGVIRRLKNRDGWAAQWYKTMAAPVLPAPGAISPPTVEVSSCGFLDNPVELDVTPTLKEAHRQRGGRMAALHTLESFLGGRGRHYSRHLSSPVTAGESCSRLSAYLTFGVLSMREVYAATESEVKRLRGDSSAEARGFARSLSSFAGRLRWHCHFIQKLEQQPELEWRNIMPLADGLREGEWSPERFQAWCAGQTGYPLVDATMRALHHTGWINFRMRAMLVSFASYHLWLDWRKTSHYLARHFLDFEPGIHYSQFQMQSGTTGINTLRMYNPTKQVEDHDPQGVFIRRWVPELEGVPPEWIAEPWRMTNGDQQRYGCLIGSQYPAPIVDHKTAIGYARSRFATLRHHEAFNEQADQIQKKLGSRRTPGQNNSPKKRPTPKPVQGDMFDEAEG